MDRGINLAFIGLAVGLRHQSDQVLLPIMVVICLLINFALRWKQSRPLTRRPMLEQIVSIQGEIESQQPSNAEELESFRLKYLSRKGIVPSLFDDLKQLPPEKRRRLESRSMAETTGRGKIP